MTAVRAQAWMQEVQTTAMIDVVLHEGVGNFEMGSFR